MSGHVLNVYVNADGDREWDIDHPPECVQEHDFGSGIPFVWWTCDVGRIAEAGDDAIGRLEDLGPGRWELRIVREPSDWAGATDAWLETVDRA